MMHRPLSTVLDATGLLYVRSMRLYSKGERHIHLLRLHIQLRFICRVRSRILSHVLYAKYA
jgi:hypothetical protein